MRSSRWQRSCSCIGAFRVATSLHDVHKKKEAITSEEALWSSPTTTTQTNNGDQELSNHDQNEQVDSIEESGEGLIDSEK